jgi:hypothetical protein
MIDDAIIEAVSAAQTEAKPLSECKFVSNPSWCGTRCGKWHRVDHTGLVGASSGWAAACGWKFAGSSASLLDVLPANLCHKFYCAKCFPEHKAQEKGRS